MVAVAAISGACRTACGGRSRSPYPVPAARLLRCQRLSGGWPGTMTDLEHGADAIAVARFQAGGRLQNGPGPFTSLAAGSSGGRALAPQPPAALRHHRWRRD